MTDSILHPPREPVFAGYIPPPASAPRRFFLWIGLAAFCGFLAGIGSVLLVSLFAMGFFEESAWGPVLSVEFDVPRAVTVDEPFLLNIVIGNPHSQTLQFSDLDIPDRFFEIFDLDSIAPLPSADSPIGGFGTQTYYYERDLDPGASYAIELKLAATQAGNHVIEFDICTSNQDCARIARAIGVRPPN